MSIDMTGWQRLSATGRDKMLSQLPRGGAPVGMQFALKIKKTGWNDGQYILDLTVRTLDLSLVLSAPTWKLWPSMLPDEMVDAIDMDMYHDIWWLLETEENPKSKSARTKFHLLDTQEGIGMQESGPSKPADSSELLRLGERQQRGVHATPTEAGSERGQPGAGGEPASQQEPPAAPCPHTAVRLIENEQGETEGFQCKACGERVG